MVDENSGGELITDINSHTNIVVFGKHTTIFSDTGIKVDTFIPDYQALEKVSILDAEVQYTCQYMAKVYVIVFRNSLSVTGMENNLIPLLITREAGLVVKDTEKSTPWIHLCSITTYIIPTLEFT